MNWTPVCSSDDLIPDAGVALRLGQQRIALFYLPQEQPSLYAVDHCDPATNAPVIARGIVGDLQGDLVVASPLHKQHYRLSDGSCLEDEALRLTVWPVRREADRIMIATGTQAAA